MSKREASAASSPARKRRKEEGQQSIDQFFLSPNRKPARTKSKHSESPVPSQIHAQSAIEIIDVDQLVEESENEPAPHQPGPSRATNDEPVRSGSPEQDTKPVQTRGFALSTAVDDVEQPPYERLSSDPARFVPQPSDFFRGQREVPYSFLAHTLLAISQTRSRIAILDTLTNALRVILAHHPDSLLPSIYLLSNSLAPPHSPVELGLGHSVISQSIQHVSGLTPAALRKLYQSTGDPGDVAFLAKSTTRTLLPHPPLLISFVYRTLIQISQTKGQGAAKLKEKLVEKLLVAAKGEETRFLVRTLCQNLRVGAVRTSILTALARAVVLTLPPASDLSKGGESLYASPQRLAVFNDAEPGRRGSGSPKKNGTATDPSRDELNQKFAVAERLLRKTYAQHPDFGSISSALLRVGLKSLSEEVALSLGTPLYPALGTPIRSLDEIYEHLEEREFTAEFKYDGQRAQIHVWEDGDGLAHTTIFSRHLELMTSKYPDVVSVCETLLRTSGAKSFIIDSEIVAINSDGSFATFQELSNRARKDVVLRDVTVPVCVYAFDLMYLNGESLLEHPFRERRSMLQSTFPTTALEDTRIARFDHVSSRDGNSGRAALEEFFERAIENKAEGLMIKLLDSDIAMTTGEKGRKKPLNATYDADKRTYSWMKLKKDYIHGLGDTLDLIPIGAWHGNGRKAQWWSPILLGVFDSSSGIPVAVCKCMSGFTDAFYKSLNERYPLSEDSTTCSRSPLWACGTGGLKPDVYFKPQEVWEIRGADITLSPVSVAAKGLISASRGLSIRFPRFLRLREDKKIEDGSTPEFLAEMWRKQEGKSTLNGGMDEGDLIDPDSDSPPDSEEDDGP